MSTPFIDHAVERLRPCAAAWQQRVDGAYTPDKLVDVARDFLASFESFEFQALPEPCRPPAALFEADIGSYAFELVRYECTRGHPDDFAHELARFFSHAATRLAQLAACHPVREDSGRRSAQA